MTDINDKSFRQTLIERFLDCDTTVAEERGLARFYAECQKKGMVPDGESDICELVTATVLSDNDAVAQESVGRCRTPRRALWRWAAAACAVVAIVVGTAVKFAAYNNDGTVLSANNGMASVPHEDVAVKAAGIAIASAPKVSVADNSDRPHSAQSAGRMVRSRSKELQPAVSKAADATNGVASAVDMNHVYDMAVSAFCDADGITVERKGGVVLLTTVDGDGTCRRYVVGEADEGQMTLAGL